MKFTYLAIDLFAVLIPFVYTFHPKIRFNRHWKAFWPASLITAALFIAWDVLYTHWGVWSFNSDYLIGRNLFFNLPLEECLFFICIPYACVFTYHCFQQLVPKNIFANVEPFLSLILPLVLVVVAIIYYFKIYTSVTFVCLAALIVFLKFVAKVNWLNQFYFSYLILLIPFFIVNGLLTGTGLESAIVRYDDSENLGIRLLTIPVEDIFYGMLLILMNVSLMEYFRKAKA